MSQSNGAGNDAENDWKRIALPLAWVAALGAVTIASLVFFYLALDRLMPTSTGDEAEEVETRVTTEIGGEEEVETRVNAEIGQYLKEKEVFCPGTWAVSRPVLFRRGVANAVADRVDEESIRRFMERPAVRRAPKVYVFGFASADGPDGVNDDLARQRAQTVKAAVRRHEPNMDVEKYDLGEDHLTLGVAHSRSARIVACDCGDGTEPEERMWTRLCATVARLTAP